MLIRFLLALQFFTPAPLAQRQPATLMTGHWSSCPEDDGEYAERALDFKGLNGSPWFEIHYGPRDEFSIFRGNTPIHIAHDSPLNLLGPAYHYNDLQTRAGGRNWSIASLGIRLNVLRLDGSNQDCYSWFVNLERDTRPTWARQ